jgi:hypothetical protein
MRETGFECFDWIELFSVKLTFVNTVLDLGLPQKRRISCPAERLSTFH